MTREIRFRAWTKWGMIYDDSVGYKIDYRGIVWRDLADDEFPTIMQFTGLLDKNGKEIFEGDIVKNNEDSRIGSVGWNNKWMKWDVGAEGYWAEDAPYVNLYFEIIGNIYENPELLNPPQGK